MIPPNLLQRNPVAQIGMGGASLRIPQKAATQAPQNAPVIHIPKQKSSSGSFPDFDDMDEKPANKTKTRKKGSINSFTPGDMEKRVLPKTPGYRKETAFSKAVATPFHMRVPKRDFPVKKNKNVEYLRKLCAPAKKPSNKSKFTPPAGMEVEESSDSLSPVKQVRNILAENFPPFCIEKTELKPPLSIQIKVPLNSQSNTIDTNFTESMNSTLSPAQPPQQSTKQISDIKTIPMPTQKSLSASKARSPGAAFHQPRTGLVKKYSTPGSISNVKIKDKANEESKLLCASPPNFCNSERGNSFKVVRDLMFSPPSNESVPFDAFIAAQADSNSHLPSQKHNAFHQFHSSPMNPTHTTDENEAKQPDSERKEEGRCNSARLNQKVLDEDDFHTCPSDEFLSFSSGDGPIYEEQSGQHKVEEPSPPHEKQEKQQKENDWNVAILGLETKKNNRIFSPLQRIKEERSPGLGNYSEKTTPKFPQKMVQRENRKDSEEAICGSIGPSGPIVGKRGSGVLLFEAIEEHPEQESKKTNTTRDDLLKKQLEKPIDSPNPNRSLKRMNFNPSPRKEDQSQKTALRVRNHLKNYEF
jgi:hypothetical protein